MKTRITLVRHGLTNENLTFTMIGVTDPPLHPLGAEVLERVGERFKDKTFDRAYSSPLIRAVQSADQILKFHPTLDLSLEPRFAEINLGIWEGRLSSEVFSERDSNQVVKDALNEELEDFTVPEGEGRREALKRFTDGLTSIAANDPGGEILVITHGGLLALLHCEKSGELLGRFRHHHPKHGSISIVEVTTSEPNDVRDGEIAKDDTDLSEIKFISFDDRQHIDDELEERIKTTSSAMRKR
ncbi:MAG: histidine phosphatase family protein [Actinomycetota bacterium]|nr:histidine phosphatase family protein [Actinomycetota bacterium]